MAKRAKSIISLRDKISTLSHLLIHCPQMKSCFQEKDLEDKEVTKGQGLSRLCSLWAAPLCLESALLAPDPGSPRFQAASQLIFPTDHAITFRPVRNIKWNNMLILKKKIREKGREVLDEVSSYYFKFSRNNKIPKPRIKQQRKTQKYRLALVA